MWCKENNNNNRRKSSWICIFICRRTSCICTIVSVSVSAFASIEVHFSVLFYFSLFLELWLCPFLSVIRFALFWKWLFFFFVIVCHYLCLLLPDFSLFRVGFALLYRCLNIICCYVSRPQRIFCFNFIFFSYFSVFLYSVSVFISFRFFFLSCCRHCRRFWFMCMWMWPHYLVIVVVCVRHNCVLARLLNLNVKWRVACSLALFLCNFFFWFTFLGWAGFCFSVFQYFNARFAAAVRVGRQLYPMDTIRGGLRREREALMIAVRTAEILTAIWAGNEVSTAENVYRHQIQKKKTK